MNIGACGIACGVCAPFIRGDCPGCVAGNDDTASQKLDTQKEKLGVTCPVLECAVSSQIGYCLKDCDKLPCDILYRGFPYSKEFLDMLKS